MSVFPDLARFSGETGYRVATISRLLKIIGLFCRISSFYTSLLHKILVVLRSLLVAPAHSTV